MSRDIMKKRDDGLTDEMIRARKLGRAMAERGVDTLTLLNFADVQWPNAAKVKGAKSDPAVKGDKAPAKKTAEPKAKA